MRLHHIPKKCIPAKTSLATNLDPDIPLVKANKTRYGSAADLEFPTDFQLQRSLPD